MLRISQSVVHLMYNAQQALRLIRAMKTKSTPKSPSIRFRIDFSDDANIGPGKIALLEGINTLGSLSAAARGLGISYRRGWLLLDSLNRSFDTPSAISAAGGQ